MQEFEDLVEPLVVKVNVMSQTPEQEGHLLGLFVASFLIRAVLIFFPLSLRVRERERASEREFIPSISNPAHPQPRLSLQGCFPLVLRFGGDLCVVPTQAWANCEL
jgi:hypothetical protein